MTSNRNADSHEMNSNDSFDLFEGVFEMRPAKAIGITASVFNLSVFAPLFAYVIFYEKFVTDKRQKQSRERTCWWTCKGRGKGPGSGHKELKKSLL